MTSMIPKQLKPVTNSFLGLWVFLAAFPFFWMFLISFRAPVDAFSFPPKLFAPITFEHFYTVWIVDGFWQQAINTTIVTLGTVTVSLTIGCLAGYALSRYRGNLGKLNAIYMDCGWRDQYHIQYGSRLIAQQLGEHGIKHRYEEFDGTHSGIDGRMDISLPYLQKALRG